MEKSYRQLKGINKHLKQVVQLNATDLTRQAYNYEIVLTNLSQISSPETANYAAYRQRLLRIQANLQTGALQDAFLQLVVDSESLAMSVLVAEH